MLTLGSFARENRCSHKIIRMENIQNIDFCKSEFHIAIRVPKYAACQSCTLKKETFPSACSPLILIDAITSYTRHYTPKGIPAPLRTYLLPPYPPRQNRAFSSPYQLFIDPDSESPIRLQAPDKRPLRAEFDEVSSLIGPLIAAEF